MSEPLVHCHKVQKLMSTMLARLQVTCLVSEQ